MNRSLTAALVGLGLFATADAADAQTMQPAGAPQQGVEVQYRYNNPGQSQTILQAAPPVQAQGQGPAQAAPAGAPAEGEGPLINTSVHGFSNSAEGQWLDAHDVYFGVIPGDRDSLPHLTRTQRHGHDGSANTLTWIGFQPFEETTRIFLQTGRPAQYQVEESPDGLTVTLRLRDTRVELSNFRRGLDTSYFGRSVSNVEAFRRGDGVTEVVIELSQATSYTVEGAGEYLYVDFAN